MHSVYNYVVEPLGGRYNNTKAVGDKELILNTEVFNHQHVNREAVVLSVPQAGAPLGYSGGGGGQGGAGVPPASVGLPFTLVDAPFKARHNHHLGATPKVHVNSPAVAQCKYLAALARCPS